MANKTTNHFKEIVINQIPLIDVRAPIEFNKGAFINAVNLPIMNDEERHLVGIRYKEQGNDEATKLGYELVSGEIKNERVKAWINHINQYPDSMIYCFRGGSRSRISQEWIEQATGKEIIRLQGGYKAFRNYLLDALTPDYQTSTPILLTGNTGSGKTILLKQFENAIDLEGIANHRGSSFGDYITPQPSQIDFENNLAYALIMHKHKGYKYMILEDESNNIGKRFMPKPLIQYFRSGHVVLLDVPFEKRVQNTLNEYVIESQKDYIHHYQKDGLSQWFHYIQKSIDKAQKRLGGERYKQISEAFINAYEYQLKTGLVDHHKDWIEQFLKEYYDPMYNYQIEKRKKDILFKGNEEEVYAFLKQYHK